MNNIVATIITLAIAISFLRLMDFFAHKGWIESKLSRKLIHIGTGPIFVLCWLMFPNVPSSRWLAALVPFMIVLQFALVGLGIIKDEASVQAMSRTGDRREILRGPLFYGIMFVLLTIVFWKDSPIGIVALMVMCGGDGVADVVGRRIQSPKLSWSSEKSIAGSISVFVGGWIFSALVLFIFVNVGVFPAPFKNYFMPISLIAFSCMLVESLPFKDIDNITATLTAVVIGYFVF